MEVELRQLSKRYHQVGVVLDLSLSTRDGEFLVLLGPSGCGKTTTLRMIAGLTPPDGGDVVFDGRRVNDVHPSRRDIAMVFQDYALYPHKTVFENMAFNLRIRRIPQPVIREKVEGVARLMSIDHLLHRKPRDLSGGERQRVAVGRAIVRDPRLFLMDEPLSNLDAKLREQMRVELKALQRRLRVTTVYVTHDQGEAMLLADRIAVMSSGRLQQLGTPEEIYRYPVNLFTATFVGSPRMNILQGALRVAGEVEFVMTGADGRTAWRLPLPNALRAIAGLGERPVELGFRPESGRVLPGWEDDGALRLSLDFVEQLGPDTLLVARLGQEADGLLRDHRLILRVSTQHALPSGRLSVRLGADDVYLFDHPAGQALYCRGRPAQGVESAPVPEVGDA